MAVEVRKQLKQGQWYVLISSCDQVPKIQLFDWIILPFPVESFLEEHIFFASFPSWIDRIIQFFLISKIIQFLKRVEVKLKETRKQIETVHGLWLCVWDSFELERVYQCFCLLIWNVYWKRQMLNFYILHSKLQKYRIKFEFSQFNLIYGSIFCDRGSICCILVLKKI